MRVTFVMGSYSEQPIGGHRVHYEFANRLAARGHSVTIFAHIESRRARFGLRRRGLRRYVSWFNFDPRIRHVVSGNPAIPSSDVAILTGWRTAEKVPSIRPRTRATVQIAYDYERWMVADAATRDRMARAFAHADVLIGTSEAVTGMLRDAGREPDATITCGIDLDAFKVLRNPSSRSSVIGFIARPAPVKRCRDALTALESVRETHDVRVLLAGPGRMDLPPWVEVFDAPTDDAMRAFYNELSVFVLPSEYEGWGLPAVEAMACGAAVVTTRCGGVEDFATDGVNALMVQPRDPASLAAACRRLLEDDRTRRRLIDSATVTAQTMRWEPSVDALEALLAGLSR